MERIRSLVDALRRRCHGPSYAFQPDPLDAAAATSMQGSQAMSDPIYEILDHLRKEVQSLRVENDRLRRSRNDEIAAAGELRKEISRLQTQVRELKKGAIAADPFAAPDWVGP